MRRERLFPGRDAPADGADPDLAPRIREMARGAHEPPEAEAAHASRISHRDGFRPGSRAGGPEPREWMAREADSMLLRMSESAAAMEGPKAIGSDEQGFRAVLRLLAAAHPKGARILDAPAGRGALTWRLRDAGYDVAACDIAPEAFEVEGISCDWGDLNDALPYPDASFDAVVSCNGVHRVFALGRCISEYARVLRPGGSLYVTLPNYTKIGRRLRFLFRGLNSTNQARSGAVIDDAEANFRRDLGLPQLLFALQASKLTLRRLEGARTRRSRVIAHLPLLLLLRLGGLFVPSEVRRRYFLRETNSFPALFSDFLVLEARKE